MTPLGWLFLGVSLSFVWGLAGWCYYLVLSRSDKSGETPARDQ